MSSGKQKGKDMVPQRRQVEVVALPITISTLMIDGKRLSASIWKQIAVEPLLDEESGELRGMPLGWVNVHQKECPIAFHLHVLWMRENALRLATVAGPTESERYQTKKRQSLSLRRQLTELLAYTLGVKFRFPESAYTNEELRTLKIDGYTLPVSKQVAHLLDALEEARTCLDQEQALWQSHQETNADFTKALAAAQALREQLEKQSIRLAHPALYNHRDKRLPSYERTDDDEEKRPISVSYEGGPERSWLRLPPASPEPKRPKKGKWFLWGKGENGQILWHTPGEVSEEDILAVEKQISKQASLLPAFLAQQTVERDRQAVQKAIEEKKEHLADVLAAASPSQKKSSLTPKALFALIQQERDRFDAYTQRWQQVIADLQESEQLFLLS
jgi:hypothetical protein